MSMNSDQNHIVHNFKKKIITKNSKLLFKFNNINYNFWCDKVLIQILSIKIKNIFNNRKTECSDLTDNNIKIWEIKNKTVFNMLFSSFKFFIYQIIKNQIDKNQKNATEFWIIFETEYRIHTANYWMQLIKKFRIISMNSYDKNVQIYISDFHNIYNKLKNMSFIIEFWLLNNIFICERMSRLCESFKEKKSNSIKN